jgi:tRNA (5-methylaminomethyl-2-thiouridylate)-methyltransferase
MKIAVLLSGGVDSSVALRLLKEEGHDVTAFYLKIWLQDEFSFLGDCPWEEDLKFAQAVCKQAEISLETINMQTEYWDSVVSYTISEVKEGRTPNPDMFCNRLIKFGQFINKIDTSYEKVASGHYAKVEYINNKYYLKTSPDPIKDQTYFLAYLTQEQLSRALFPLGNYNKKQIRAIAKKYDLLNMSRKDSQGICFLGQIKFNDFVKHHLGEIEGEIIDIDSNKVMGKHRGYYFYTIGQRSGLRLGGGPWYVIKKDIQENIIYISKENLIKRSRNEFKVGKFNWISNKKPSDGNYLVKIRHGENFYKCNLIFDNDSAIVKINEEDRGIAPGQFAVFYKDDICLGASVILE